MQEGLSNVQIFLLMHQIEFLFGPSNRQEEHRWSNVVLTSYYRFFSLNLFLLLCWLLIRLEFDHKLSSRFAVKRRILCFLTWFRGVEEEVSANYSHFVEDYEIFRGYIGHYEVLGLLKVCWGSQLAFEDIILGLSLKDSSLLSRICSWPDALNPTFLQFWARAL